MGAARRIYKNTMYLGAAEIVSRILQFVIMLYAARALSQEHFGKFSFALALSLIAMVLADLGIGTLLVREISRNKDLAGKYFINAFFIKIALSVITYLIVFVVLNILKYPDDTRHIVYIVWLFAMLSTFTEMFYSIFRAFEVMAYDAFLKIVRMILLSLASLYVLFKGYGVLAFSLTFVLIEIVVVLAALLIALNKFINLIKLKPLIDCSFMRSLLKKALPFGLSAVFGMTYFFIGAVMLSKMRGDAEVAIYSAAYNIALALLFVPTVYTNAIYPVLSRYYHERKRELKTLYEKSFKYLYIIGLPISIGLYLLAGRIIFFLYGEPYSGAIIALQVISLYLFIKFVNFLFGTLLASIDEQNKRMICQGATAAFNILLNVILIPKIGYIGAAFSTLITEIFLFALYYLYVSKSWYFYNFINALAKPAISAIAMGLFIKFSGFGLIATILLSTLIYFAALFILKGLDQKDYSIIRSIFKNGRLQESL